MNKKALEKEIDSRIISLSEEIEELKELVKPISPENAIGRISRMDAINNKSVNEASLRAKQAMLSNLNSAKSRIDDNDFGICLKCGLPIPEGRLILMPQARKCVNCS
jgi:DnaK suppressor protein